MSAMTPISNDHSLKIAWDKYKLTEDFSNTRKWALHEQHVDGSLWAAFSVGFDAGSNRQLEKELNEANENSTLVFKRLEFVRNELKVAVEERNTLAKEMSKVDDLLSARENLNDIPNRLDKLVICINAMQSVSELAKENKAMREALMLVKPCPLCGINHNGLGHDIGCKIGEALQQPVSANLIVLTRDELIAEIEKMECTCSFERYGAVAICHRCQWLARVKL